MVIVGLNKTTLLDYPGRVAATIFVGGCNFRCPFCHNGGIVLEPLSQGSYEEAEIFAFLKKRKNVLKGVCITGGEPTLQKDLVEFVEKVKDLGYQVKLDTNGSAPEVLKALLKKKLLDYVAMDLKNCPEKYAMTVGMDKQWKKKEQKDRSKEWKFCESGIQESVSLLMDSGIDYEFRTTVVKELHTREDLLKIAEWIQGCPRYFLQQYRDSENILFSIMNRDETQEKGEGSSGKKGFHGYNKEELNGLAEAVRKAPGMTGEVAVRGIE